MKFLLLRKFVWLALFTLVHLWFIVFNWQLFITMLNINLGFGIIRLPPFIFLFFTGFIFLAIQSWFGYINKLHRIIRDLEDELNSQKKERQLSPKNGENPKQETGAKHGSIPEKPRKDPAGKDILNRG